MSHASSPAETIELSIEGFSSGSLDPNSARKNIRAALLKLGGMWEDTSLSFAQIFARLAATEPSRVDNQLSMLTIRLVSCDGLLPDTIEGSAGRHLVTIIERGNDKITSILPDNKKVQNHERLTTYSKFHYVVCEELQILTQSISGLHDLVGRRESLMRMLNQGPLKSYLNPLEFQFAATSISSILKLVQQTTKSHVRELQNNLQNLLETVNDAIGHLESKQNFFVKDFVLPFLKNVEIEINSYQTRLAEKFDCSIVPPADVYDMPKKYPLHVTNTPIELHIPLTKTEQGVALNVRAECFAEHCTVQTDKNKPW